MSQTELNTFIADYKAPEKKKFIAVYKQGGSTFRIPVNSLAEALPAAVLPEKDMEEFESLHNYNEHKFNLETANDLLQIL